MNKTGKEIFNSNYYEGEDGKCVRVYFKNYDDYNIFLNWWVLGKKSKELDKKMV